MPSPQTIWYKQKSVQLLGWFFIVFMSIAFWVAILVGLLALNEEFKGEDPKWSNDKDSNKYIDESAAAYEDCNVAVIPLHGFLSTIPGSAYDYDDESSESADSTSIVQAIEAADADDDVKAIVLEIDSYGGGSVADEEIANALQRASKPAISLIRSAGVSAAYYAATGADRIFASIDSEVGGIGVTGSYIENWEANNVSGYVYQNLSIGALKEAGNPDKELSDPERALLLRNMQDMYDNFVLAVARNRHMDEPRVRELADGGTMLGTRALQSGLIDEVGGFYEVKNYLRGLIDADVTWCR